MAFAPRSAYDCRMDKIIEQLRAEAAKIAAEWYAAGLAGGTIYEDFAVELAKRAVAAERERCARLCDEAALYYANVVIDEQGRRAAQDCADEIRGS